MRVSVSVAPWLPADLDPRRRAVVEAAMSSLGIAEEPKGSNRSPTIDRWNQAVGVDVGSPWCASFASACWAAGQGAFASASCEAWHGWAKNKPGRWVTSPEPGDVVLYALGADRSLADHAGIVVRADHGYLFTAEGNSNGNGSREGYWALLQDRTGAPYILGFVSLTGGQ